MLEIYRETMEDPEKGVRSEDERFYTFQDDFRNGRYQAIIDRYRLGVPFMFELENVFPHTTFRSIGEQGQMARIGL